MSNASARKPVGIPIDALLDDEELPESLRERIMESDKNKDGILSAQELVGVIVAEQKAARDARLFRRFVWALIAAVLLLIAAVVGSVYGIVYLTRQVDDDGGVLTSARSGAPMTTGTTLQRKAFAELVHPSTAKGAALGTSQVILPTGDSSFAVLGVAGIAVEEGKGATIRAQTGEVIMVDEEGAIVDILTADGDSLMACDVDVQRLRCVSPGNSTVSTPGNGQRRRLHSRSIQYGGEGIGPATSSVAEFDDCEWVCFNKYARPGQEAGADSGPFEDCMLGCYNPPPSSAPPFTYQDYVSCRSDCTNVQCWTICAERCYMSPMCSS